MVSLLRGFRRRAGKPSGHPLGPDPSGGRTSRGALDHPRDRRGGSRRLRDRGAAAVRPATQALPARLGGRVVAVRDRLAGPHAGRRGGVVALELQALLPVRRDPERAVAGNVVGTLVVLGGAVVSGLALRHRRELRPRFEGNLLIALGVAFAAGGGVFAFLDQSGKLGAGLAVGACVMYLGFWRASTPVRSPMAARPSGAARTGPAAP